MWKDLPENEKEEYKRMILAFASLTELFSQKNEENDEIPAPIINSKYQETIFQKAFHASAEDIGNTSYDVAINGKNIGNRLKKYLIGIKTFGIGSGDQKVAQFKANLNEWSSIINQMQKNAKNENGTLKKKSEIDLVNKDLYKELAVKISMLRNERICSSRANLQGFKVKDEDEVESVYHVLMPSSKLLLLETKDWDENGNYIPNEDTNTGEYDEIVLMRIRPNIDDVIKRKPDFWQLDVAEQLEFLKSIKWEFEISGYITHEDLQYIIRNHYVIKQGDRLGKVKENYNGIVMDADNYYVQVTNMRKKEELLRRLSEYKK